MITVISAPLENRILLDGNNTLISVTSTNGVGYYFRAEIYINDILFDTQGWSRKDGYTAEKDLKKIYNAYFKRVFNQNFVNGLFEQSHLIAKISIVVKEFALSNDLQSDEIILNDFYIMYNEKPSTFDDEPKVQFLAMDPEIYLIPKTGKIAVSFMANADNESVIVELKNNFGTTLNTISSPVFSGKKMFVYQLSLADLVLVQNTIFFNLKINVGAESISKNYRLMKYPDFPIKELAFVNNFGFWNFVYLDGQMTIDNGLNIETYQEFDGRDRIFDIDETKTFTINSGSLLPTEKEILRQITNSLESKLFLNGEWLEIVGTTKKVNHFKDRNNLYSENLTFTVKPKPVANTAMGQILSALQLIHISTSEAEIKFEVLYNGENPADDYILDFTLFLSYDGGQEVLQPTVDLGSGHCYFSVANLFSGACMFYIGFLNDTVTSNIVTLEL